MEKALRPLRAGACSTIPDALSERTACNVFVAKALDLLYGVTDFGGAGKGYFVANEIATGMSQPGNRASMGWSLIGKGDDQAALVQAQTLANAGLAVIAVREGRPKANATGPTTLGPGHVVLILPGTLEKYAATEPGGAKHDWGNLQTPNSASQFLDRADKMYLGCPLSSAWRKPDAKILLLSKQPLKKIASRTPGKPARALS